MSSVHTNANNGADRPGQSPCLGGRLISMAWLGYYFLRSNTVRADDQIRASIQLQPKYPGWNSTEQKARSVNGPALEQTTRQYLLTTSSSSHFQPVFHNNYHPSFISIIHIRGEFLGTWLRMSVVSLYPEQCYCYFMLTTLFYIIILTFQGKVWECYNEIVMW